MKLPYKIALIAVGINLLLALLMTLIHEHEIDTFYDYYSSFALLVGTLSTAMALICFVSGKKQWQVALGFVLTAAILLLTGFFTHSLISDNYGFGR